MFIFVFYHEEHEGHEEGTKHPPLGFLALPFVLFVSFVVVKSTELLLDVGPGTGLGRFVVKNISRIIMGMGKESHPPSICVYLRHLRIKNMSDPQMTQMHAD